MEITIRNLQKRIPVSPKRAKKVVLKALSWQKSRKPGQITVCFLDDKQIKELNLMYLGKDEPTDVIAFDMSEGKKEFSADIAVSAQAAIRNARIFRTCALYELYLYVVHGVLHILGYRDDNQKQRKIMQRRAERICQSIRPRP